jgi:hypothetical protein
MGWLKYEGTRAAEVYALVDPRGENVVYVGRTVSGSVSRLRSHLKTARAGKSNARSSRWIRGLLDSDLRPEILVLEAGEWTCDYLGERETYWIDFFGDALVNHTRGGDGGFNEGLLRYNQRPRTTEDRARSAEGQRQYVARMKAAGTPIDYSPMQNAHPARNPEKREAWLAAVRLAAQRREAAKRA